MPIMVIQVQLLIIRMAFITTTLLRTILISMEMVFMEHPVRFRNSIMVVLIAVFSCGQTKNTFAIPDVFVNVNSAELKQKQGFLYYRDTKFSGHTIALYSTGDTALVFSYYE